MYFLFLNAFVHLDMSQPQKTIYDLDADQGNLSFNSLLFLFF
jgi:hypothetical protein